MSHISVIKLPDNSTYDIKDNNAIPANQKGAANGVVPLNGSSKIDSTYLPSYVDDVIEGYYYNNKFWKESTHTTEITGEAGKIYINLETNPATAYRYNGSTFVQIGSGGSVITITRDLTSGVKSATINVNGTDFDIYSTEDTSYSAMSASEITTGTATTLRTMRADYLRSGLLDLFYPIGSYYETSDENFNPNTAWGGTWVKETDGLFHRSATSVSGANQNNGAGTQDGGASTVALTPAETATKAHGHNYTCPPSSTDSFTLTTNHIPAHTHGNKSLTGSWYAAGVADATVGTTGIVGHYATSNGAYTGNGANNRAIAQMYVDASHEHDSVGSGWGHSHTITNSTASTTGNPVDANGVAHENKPPYVDVVRWHRTA